MHPECSSRGAQRRAGSQDKVGFNRPQRSDCTLPSYGLFFPASGSMTPCLPIVALSLSTFNGPSTHLRRFSKNWNATVGRFPAECLRDSLTHPALPFSAFSSAAPVLPEPPSANCCFPFAKATWSLTRLANMGCRRLTSKSLNAGEFARSWCAGWIPTLACWESCFPCSTGESNAT